MTCPHDGSRIDLMVPATMSASASCVAVSPSLSRSCEACDTFTRAADEHAIKVVITN